MNKICIKNKAQVFFYRNVTANLSSGGTDFPILLRLSQRLKSLVRGGLKPESTNEHEVSLSQTH